MLPVGGFQKGERILKVVALNLCCFLYNYFSLQLFVFLVKI